MSRDPLCWLLSYCLEPKNKTHFVSCCPVDWSPKTRPILSRRPLYLAVCCLGQKKRLILSRGPLYQGQLPPLLEASSPGCCLVCFKGQYALYFFKTQKKPILEPIRVSTKNDPSWAQKKKERNWRDWLPMLPPNIHETWEIFPCIRYREVYSNTQTKKTDLIPYISPWMIPCPEPKEGRGWNSIGGVDRKVVEIQRQDRFVYCLPSSCVYFFFIEDRILLCRQIQLDVIQ